MRERNNLKVIVNCSRVFSDFQTFGFDWIMDVKIDVTRLSLPELELDNLSEIL